MIPLYGSRILHVLLEEECQTMVHESPDSMIGTGQGPACGIALKPNLTQFSATTSLVLGRVVGPTRLSTSYAAYAYCAVY